MWDLRSSRCARKFSNEGGMTTCALALSRDKLAVASESGVVNLFSADQILAGNRTRKSTHFAA